MRFTRSAPASSAQLSPAQPSPAQPGVGEVIIIDGGEVHGHRVRCSNTFGFARGVRCPRGRLATGLKLDGSVHRLEEDAKRSRWNADPGLGPHADRKYTHTANAPKRYYY